MSMHTSTHMATLTSRHKSNDTLLHVCAHVCHGIRTNACPYTCLTSIYTHISHDLYGYGLYSHGLYSYGLYRWPRFSQTSTHTCLKEVHHGMFAQMSPHTSVRRSAHVSAHDHSRLRTCLHTCLYTYLHTCLHKYLQISRVRTHVCTHVYTHV